MSSQEIKGKTTNDKKFVYKTMIIIYLNLDKVIFSGGLPHFEGKICELGNRKLFRSFIEQRVFQYRRIK